MEMVALTNLPQKRPPAGSPTQTGGQVSNHKEASMADKKLHVVPEQKSEDVSIAKPAKKFNLDKFKSKQSAAMANVQTLQTALPHHSIAQAKDYVRLHPN